ncbi:Peptidyl-dipeptidase Dcp [Plesiocystis pacifica SIR-1]|uniref:Peptidyl-dipeptidase Dcp n=1 Tax=Plesiocystis pacifica SIR-1 TaxID=391625 RepID=A6G237_9BACT|nr:M3 family metallopeptidase [Plesiocystis pacifica]EDM80006.1 Peptidyl-dipeptidase Dcp [Plesiocystis pacifica SIR-1]
MRSSSFVLALASAVSIVACSHSTSTQTQPDLSPTSETAPRTDSDNPMLTKSTLQYEAPDYSKVELAHFRPAFDQGMEEQAAEIQAIATSEEPPTFENTIVAMERSGAILDRATSVFFSMSGTVSNDEIRALEAEYAPKFSAHYDSINLDAALFARVEAVYQARESLSGEDLRLVEKIYTRFVRAGAKLDEGVKTEIRAINSEMSELTTKFSQNVLASTEKGAVLVDDEAQLAGLSESQIAGLGAAAKAAGHDGKFLISLLNTTRHPLLSSLENRELRERLWKASSTRGVADNGPVLLRIVALRARKAKLLGYETWADYVLAEQMAQKPAAVLKILDDLAPQVADKTKAEAKEIQKAIKADGKKFELQPWDWFYYAEKVRTKKFDLDEAQVRAYFELERVRNDGLFFTMEQLFGITFKERDDLPTYHPDVRTFEVFDEDGSSIGLFYADYFAREGKRGGAWMNAIVGQSKLLGRKPVIVNCLNIPKPAEGEPALLTFDEVQTMFHEMGHGVHGLFSDATYPTLAGTSVPRDYVEFPSQFEEDWAIDPKVLGNFAKHYQTGEAIPPELLTKLLDSRKFNQGFDSAEYLGSALLDMEWHLLADGEQVTAVTDVEAFERAALDKHGLLMAAVPPRYKSPYFSHTFAGGYSAGYYAYLWTEVLAADAFAYMGTQGGLTRANGDLFREKILSRGNTIEPMEQYVNYRGQEPSVDALLRRRGLIE